MQHVTWYRLLAVGALFAPIACSRPESPTSPAALPLSVAGGLVSSASSSTRDCPKIGDVCADGSVFAGLSLEPTSPKRTRVYTTPANAPGTYTWNNGSTIYATTGFTGWFGPGKTYSAGLAALTDGESPHVAALYCETLVAHGRTDWYLPAQWDLGLIDTNRATIGGVPIGDYWSSSEMTAGTASGGNTGTHRQITFAKERALLVRCQRLQN